MRALTWGTHVFPNNVPTRQFARFQAQGFPQPVSGIVYEGGHVGDGLPLGGLGTGYLELASDGTLGKTSIFNHFTPPYPLRSPFLAVSTGGTVRVLALDVSGMSSARDLRYWGHFPIADLQYGLDLPLGVSLRAFAPFIPGDAAASNIPAAAFIVYLTNAGATDLEGVLALSFPGFAPAGVKPVHHERFCSAELRGVSVTDAKGAGYALAVQAHGDTEVGGAFSEPEYPWSLLREGKVPPLEEGHPGVSAKVSFHLLPGATARVVFFLAWYYPVWRDSDGRPRQHRYSFRFDSPRNVVDYLSANWHALLDRILLWQAAIYESALPPWLQDALINSLYSLAKNTLWLASDRQDDWWGENGLLVHSESFTGCPIVETMVCRFHGHLPLLLFFPELELSTLRAFKHFQLSTGEIPFCFGHSTSVDRPHYYIQHPLNSCEYVQLVYRFFRRTGDSDFLRDFYPSVIKAISFAKSLDYDADGLVNEHPHAPEGELWPANQFYDIWPWHGTSAYVAGVWLATLCCARAMAYVIGDKSFAHDCEVWLQQGLHSFESKLWNGRYYRVYNEPETGRTNEASLFNQLMAEWCCRIVGLEGCLPKERVLHVINSLEKLNLSATGWLPVNAATPEGRPEVSRTDGDPNDHASQCFVGESLCAAMTMMYHGHSTTGLRVAERIVESLFVRHLTPWNQHCLLAADDGRPVWGSDYYSNMVIWAVPLALAGEDLTSVTRPGGLLARIVAPGP
jgi:non-lysosomal glucosylceramidase